MNAAEAGEKFDSIKEVLLEEVKEWTKTNIEPSEGGQGGTVWNISPAIDSLSVIDTVLIAEKTLKIKIEPEEVILKGGYETTDEFLEDFLPKVKAVYIDKLTKDEEKENA